MEERVTMADNDGDEEVGMAVIAGFKHEKKNAMMLRFLASMKGIMVSGTYPWP